MDHLSLATDATTGQHWHRRPFLVSRGEWRVPEPQRFFRDEHTPLRAREKTCHDHSHPRPQDFFASSLCILVSVIALSGCREEEKPPEVIRAIRWTSVTESTSQLIRRISGTTKPVDQTALSFAVSGTVEKGLANLGDRVKKGQVLAELDKQPFTLAVRDAQAAVSKAKAIMTERRANYQRTMSLYEADNASKSDLDEARASRDSARSQVKAAEAQLGLARRDLNKTVLRAPFNSRLSRSRTTASSWPSISR